MWDIFEKWRKLQVSFHLRKSLIVSPDILTFGINCLWLYQHILPAPVSRCFKSIGSILIMFTGNVRSNFIQPQGIRSLWRYRLAFFLCRILVQLLRMTFAKTCATCQRHVDYSIHGGLLMLFYLCHFVIEGHIRETYE